MLQINTHVVSGVTEEAGYVRPGKIHENAPIFQAFINDAKAMLEEEANMVDAAYTAGATKGVEFERVNQNGIWQEWPNGFDYYKETFNTKKVV